ncbi:MAG: PUA domain-containing protein, partial [Candidatus Thermoplasmatota archaeon]|nr:PUA domain-containing protein [Candidatus Thermoplasmatota archaeon]
ERGVISLTIGGAKRLGKLNRYCVEISEDFELVGSIFAPGVLTADEIIRIGDEAVVKRAGKVCAVGVAQMNGEEMVSSTFGEAIKVRHRL